VRTRQKIRKRNVKAENKKRQNKKQNNSIVVNQALHPTTRKGKARKSLTFISRRSTQNSFIRRKKSECLGARNEQQKHFLKFESKLQTSKQKLFNTLQNVHNSLIKENSAVIKKNTFVFSSFTHNVCFEGDNIIKTAIFTTA
jgi:hypothetical protein